MSGGAPQPAPMTTVDQAVAAGSSQRVANLRRLGYTDAQIRQDLQDRYGVSDYRAGLILTRANHARDQAALHNALPTNQALRRGQVRVVGQVVNRYVYSVSVAYTDGQGNLRYTSGQMIYTQPVSTDRLRSDVQERIGVVLVARGLRDADGYPITDPSQVIPDTLLVRGVERVA